MNMRTMTMRIMTMKMRMITEMTTKLMMKMRMVTMTIMTDMKTAMKKTLGLPKVILAAMQEAQAEIMTLMQPETVETQAAVTGWKKVQIPDMRNMSTQNRIWCAPSV